MNKSLILVISLFAINLAQAKAQNTGTTGTHCVPPPSHMVAWWSLDETSGTSSADLAGFNNIGTHFNGPIPVVAKVSFGLQFDGIDDYVEAPDHSELNFGTGDFSFDAWIQTRDSTGVKILVDKRTAAGAASNATGYCFSLTNGKLSLIMADGTSTTYISTLFVADGQWHHIAVTVWRSNANGIKFYRDGTFVTSGDPTLRPGSLTNVSPLRIGSLSAYTHEIMFRGILDEIELFNRELQQHEVQSIYGAGSAGKCKFGSLCGVKFSDLNGDGHWDTGSEPTLPNWTINMSGTGTATTTTDATGHFCFYNLPAGTYTLSEVNQTGCQQTAPASPGTFTISLSAGQSIDTLYFGNRCGEIGSDTCNFLINSDFEIPTVPSGFIQTLQANVPGWKTTASDGKIELWNGAAMLVPAFSGAQFAELNCTRVGVLYQNFNAIAGRTVLISFAHRGRFPKPDVMRVEIGPAGSTTWTPIGPTYSDDKTAWSYYTEPYTFPATITNPYQIRFVSVSSNGVSLPDSAGGNFLDAITITCPSSICGFKFNDLDGDGTWDSSTEPKLPNWTFNLAGTMTATATTDADGHFCFGNLPPGTYTVSEVNQTGCQQTTPPSPGTYTITLAEGQDIDTLKFGNRCDTTDICSLTDARLTKIAQGECCYQVEISNKYLAGYFTGIRITSDNLTLANVSSGNTWSTISYQSPTKVVFTETPSSTGVPLNTTTLGTICFAGSGPSNIEFSFIGPAPRYDTICPKIIRIEGCNVTPDTTCVAVLDLLAECDAGTYTMKFRIKNNSTSTVRGITLYSQNPDVTPAPKFIPIADLLPNQVSVFYQTLLNVTNNAKNVCFFFAACDQSTQPGENGEYPRFCCIDSIPYCVNIPSCEPCDDITFTATKTDPSDCCYNLSLTSTYYPANIGYLEFTGVGGTQFALLSGWTILSVGSSHIKIQAPVAGGVLPGTYPDFASFCLTGASIPPFTVLVKSFDANEVYLCTDTLNFEKCQLVDPTCANIINDSLYCSGDKINYTFSVKNNSPFPLYWIDLRTTDPSVVLNTNHIQPVTPIAMGDTGGPYTVSIDSADINLVNFCMYLTGHNGVYDPELGLAATECCTDSLGVVCLPMVKCGECETTICCDFASMTIPTGITPNEDGINDTFEIGNATCCEYISIKVYNRWGNRVYQNDDYQNDWRGVNEKGDKLVQGTYFIVLELPTGNKKGFYVDVRY